MYIQIGVMERDVHGARGGESPAEEAKGSASPAPVSSRKSRQRAEDYTVIVDLPDSLPITEPEIELLESELTDFIAELLKK